MKDHAQIQKLRTRQSYITRLATNTKLNGEPRGYCTVIGGTIAYDVHRDGSRTLKDNPRHHIPVSHLLADPLKTQFGPRVLEAQIRKLEGEK